MVKKSEKKGNEKSKENGMVEVVFILDRSGSMSGLEEDTCPKNTVSIVGGQFVVFLFPLGITGILLVLVRRVGYLELPHQVHRHHGDGHDRRFGVVGLESAV